VWRGGNRGRFVVVKLSAEHRSPKTVVVDPKSDLAIKSFLLQKPLILGEPFQRSGPGMMVHFADPKLGAIYLEGLRRPFCKRK